ncbi:MAG: NAD-binding protein [Armatimonadota bacterium]
MVNNKLMYVIVVGGGRVGYHLAKTLVSEGHEVLLVEKDPSVAAKLAESLGEFVMCGDGCEIRTMAEAGMSRANVVVAVTGDDEDNLVICQMAKKRFEVPRTIAKVNNPNNEPILQKLGIDQTINSTRIIFNMIEKQIDTCEMVPLAALKNGNIEIVEADIPAKSSLIGKKVSQLELPPNTLIISIIRDQHAIIPHADTKLREQDSLIALIKSDKARELRAMFSTQ